MFARFKNLFTKATTPDNVLMPEMNGKPENSITIAERTAELLAEPQIAPATKVTAAPLAEVEEDLKSVDGMSVCASANELSKLLDAISQVGKLNDYSSEDHDDNDDGDDDDDDDETASTSSVKTKIAKASLERDIIFEASDELEADNNDLADKQEQVPNAQQSAVSTVPLESLDKLRALIRNDSETYPQSDYSEATDSRTISIDSDKLDDLNAQILHVSSVVGDDLPLDKATATVVTSPANDSGRSSNNSDELQAEIPVARSAQAVLVRPTGENAMACNAIANKLSEIAEVAESLDAVIRDVQQATESFETEDTVEKKKLGALRSTSSEDWQSRSTEDDSFLTASEGNCTPYSHASSFQTASGCTSSYIGSAKNSFDVSESDDVTLAAFEIPDMVNSPVNISYNNSEQSIFSTYQQQQQQQQQQQEQHVAADIDEEIINNGKQEPRSQSATPQPESIQIESETELEMAGIVDPSAIQILTELSPTNLPSATPEVSNCMQTHETLITPEAANNNTNNNSSNNSKQNATWQRSKYYENITKQTIKGFL